MTTNLAHRLCCYGVPSLSLRVMQLRDTYHPVDPATPPDRLHRAGLIDVRVDVRGGEQLWRVVKPS